MLRGEIGRCMSEFQGGHDGHLSARFVFPEGFTGFKGHFPGNPVLPGICMVQALLVMLETRRQVDPALKEIVMAKFFSTVAPGTELQFDSREQAADDGTTLAKASVTAGDKKIAQLSVKVVYGPSAV
jgi:3-hydroxyacyl-[acyl-carrier-protein] dehydratase